MRGRLNVLMLVLLVLEGSESLAGSDGATSAKGAQPASMSPSDVDLSKLMTPTEIESAGIRKLTIQEIASLNQWVAEFAMKKEVRSDTPRNCNIPIESSVSNEYAKNGNTPIIKLRNGQVWKQIKRLAPSRTKPTSGILDIRIEGNNRDVIIYRSGRTCVMKSPGDDSGVIVEIL